MIEPCLWHPVLQSSLLRDTPLGVDLMGTPVVLWRESGHEAGHGHAAMSSVVHAWEDRCPHRGARLSLGRVLTHVHGARLECAYHGWQFAGQAASHQSQQGHDMSVGRCALVPAAPDFSPPDSHCVTVFEARESDGLIWVRLRAPDEAMAPPVALLHPPAMPQWQAQGWRTVVCGPYEVQTSAPRLVENFLDLSHFGFVHESYLGTRSHAQVEVGTVVESSGGVRASKCRAWQPQGYASENGHMGVGRWVEYDYAVAHPFGATLVKTGSGGDPVSNAISVHIRPDGNEACTAWFAMATLGDPSTDAELMEFQDTIFSQDKPVIESQQPRRLPLGTEGGPREMHGPADRMSSAYRRYLSRLGIVRGVC